MRPGALYIPLATATMPATGECLAGRFWIVHPEFGATFFLSKIGPARHADPSPQCSPVKATAEQIQRQLWPGHKVQFLPIVFLRHAEVEALRQLRKGIDQAA